MSNNNMKEEEKRKETYSEKVKRWKAVERGEIPDTYDNAFLSHMGFYDDTRKWEKDQQRRYEHEADLRGGATLPKSSRSLHSD